MPKKRKPKMPIIIENQDYYNQWNYFSSSSKQAEESDKNHRNKMRLGLKPESQTKTIEVRNKTIPKARTNPQTKFYPSVHQINN